MFHMRTTVDLPDELLRRAKSEAALRGRKLKDLIDEGLRAMIDNQSPGNNALLAEAKPKRVSAHDLLKDLIVENADGPTDLSTNPKYFGDFGR